MFGLNTDRKSVAVGVGVTVATFSLMIGLSSCGSKQLEPFRDAGVSGRNNDKAEIGTMPDGFSNWATKCDNGNRVYVVFKGDSKTRAAIAVVPSDPTCR